MSDIERTVVLLILTFSFIKKRHLVVKFYTTYLGYSWPGPFSGAHGIHGHREVSGRKLIRRFQQEPEKKTCFTSSEV